MLGLMGFSGSLPLYMLFIDIISLFINWANKDACLLEPRISQKSVTSSGIQHNNFHNNGLQSFNDGYNTTLSIMTPELKRH